MPDEQKKEIYEKIVATLEPEVDKLKALLRFHESAIATFVRHVESIGSWLADQMVPSQTFYWSAIAFHCSLCLL